MARKRVRDIGVEILRGLREIKRGEVGRVVVKKTTKGLPHLPNPDSIEELARFWDSHEITEFEDLLEESPGPVFQKRVIPRSESEE